MCGVRLLPIVCSCMLCCCKQLWRVGVVFSMNVMYGVLTRHNAQNEDCACNPHTVSLTIHTRPIRSDSHKRKKTVSFIRTFFECELHTTAMQTNHTITPHTRKYTHTHDTPRTSECKSTCAAFLVPSHRTSHACMQPLLLEAASCMQYAIHRKTKRECMYGGDQSSSVENRLLILEKNCRFVC
jgi:hypothetical protein